MQRPICLRVSVKNSALFSDLAPSAARPNFEFQSAIQNHRALSRRTLTGRFLIVDHKVGNQSLTHREGFVNLFYV